jgi:hypothetical protein
LPNGNTASEVIGPDGNRLFAAIPDGLYLDDVADNKINNRDSLTETEYTGPVPDTTRFGDASRPEYTVDSGAPFADNGLLKVPDGSATVQQFRAATTESISDITWEIDFTAQSTQSEGFYGVHLAIADQSVTWQTYRADNSYIMLISPDGRFELVQTENGNFNTIIAGSWDADTATHVGEVTVDDSGNWELFYDGVSQGTVTDTTFTSMEHIGFGSSIDAEIDHDTLRVF